MKTDCNKKTFEFQAENSRKIVAHFNGGNISSDAGGVLLKQTEQVTGIIAQCAACFTDYRDPDLIEHYRNRFLGVSEGGINPGKLGLYAFEPVLG